MILIRLNDKALQYTDSLTITEFLIDQDRLKPGCALAINHNIIPRDRWDHVVLHDGDSILLFQAIAGG